jgi:hypothetical protein
VGIVKVVKGCLVLGLAPPAALLLLASFMFTMEEESFPGWRDNHSVFALYALVLSIGAALGALAVAVRASEVLRAIAVLVCGLLLVGAVYRAYTLAPMLKCWDYNSIARGQDDSYSCFDR